MGVGINQFLKKTQLLHHTLVYFTQNLKKIYKEVPSLTTVNKYFWSSIIEIPSTRVIGERIFRTTILNTSERIKYFKFYPRKERMKSSLLPVFWSTPPVPTNTPSVHGDWT